MLIIKNTVQTLKYPSADAVTLGSKVINWKKEQFIKIDKTKMAAAASFSVSHENGKILIDSQTPKISIYNRFRRNSEKKLKKD